MKVGAETDVHVLARTVADGEATARLVAGRGGAGRLLGKDALRSALREMLPTAAATGAGGSGQPAGPATGAAEDLKWAWRASAVMASRPSAASSFGATASAQAVAAPSPDHVPSFRHGTTTHLPKAARIPKKNSRDAYLLAGGLEQFLLDVVAEELAVSVEAMGFVLGAVVDLLLVRRTIIAGVWVAFFQECQR